MLTPRRLSSFGGNVLLYAACAAAAAFAWPWIKATFGPDMTPYTESGLYRGGIGQRDRTGIEPRDFSDHFPGPRTTGGGRQFRLRLDPDVPPGQVEDRRGEHGPDIAAEDGGAEPGGGDLGRLGPAPSGRGSGRLACWDTVEKRDVPMSFCDRQDRERIGRR